MSEECGVFLERSRVGIEDRYAEIVSKLPKIFQEIEQKIKNCDSKTALAVKYLYTTMPYSDIGNYPFEIFLDYASHGVYLWENNQDVRKIPENIYCNYILYHRVNEEEIAPCRTLFYHDMKEQIKGLYGKEAALEINYWCAEKATYQSTDDRTLSALTVYDRGNGRCGEESVFLVNALRSAGIPARQVYAPKWSHCDDNHAWVELWIDGQWYFTGACEPLPILNKGWFTNASSRAMMIHSRWFDLPENAGQMGEVIGREGKVTMLNELSRYAAVKEITVFVEDAKGAPVEHAEVSFEVLNYSEYAPIAEKKTDENGRASLTTGLGSLHLHVNKDGICKAVFLDTRKEDECRIKLKALNQEKLDQEELDQEELDRESWKASDMIAPVDTPVHTDMPTKEQKEKGTLRAKEAARKRMDRVARWKNEERERFLSKEENKEWRYAMMEVLTEKDQSDCICEVLEEHLEYALPYAENLLQNSLQNPQKNVRQSFLQDFQNGFSPNFLQNFSQEIFTMYVLNPRIEDEILRCYRKEILHTFSEEEQQKFRKDPTFIWTEIERRIKSCPDQERSSVITTPSACLKLGIGSRRSKKNLFVAIARTLGIPARLNPKDRSMEYWKDGAFCAVLPESEKDSSLILRETDGTVWKYFQNWSLARLENGTYVSLHLEDEKWTKQTLELSLEEGNYRLITSNRLPNGNIFANQCEFHLKAEETKKLDLMLRKADLKDMLEQIELPEFYMKDSDGKEVRASELTKEEKWILLWLEESEEPTEHILNEMLDQKEAFVDCASKMIFILRTPEAKNDPTIAKALKAFPEVSILYDDFEENIETLGRRMYVDPDKLPLILVTDGRLNGIYATSGYNVGTGEMLLRLI